MASCPKCGKHPLRKYKDRPRACRRCGVIAGVMGYPRAGFGISVIEFTSERSSAAEAEVKP